MESQELPQLFKPSVGLSGFLFECSRMYIDWKRKSAQLWQHIHDIKFRIIINLIHLLLFLTEISFPWKIMEQNWSKCSIKSNIFQIHIWLISELFLYNIPVGKQCFSISQIFFLNSVNVFSFYYDFLNCYLFFPSVLIPANVWVALCPTTNYPMHFAFCCWAVLSRCFCCLQVRFPQLIDIILNSFTLINDIILKPGQA